MTAPTTPLLLALSPHPLSYMIKILILFNLLILIIFIINYLLITNYIHPIHLIIIIILYSIIICLLISLQTYNYIYSIILFLIIIRGLLIIFLYFSRLISNDQNKLSINIYILLNIIINSLTISYYLHTNKYFLYLPYISQENSSSYKLNNNIFINIFKIYVYPFNNFTFTCILFLLISLFTIIKICRIKSSSLRKIIYE